MNRDRKKLTALLCLCVAFAVVILISNNGTALQGLTMRPAAAAVASPAPPPMPPSRASSSVMFRASPVTASM